MNDTAVNVLYMILVLVLIVGAIIILWELTDKHFQIANGQQATKAPEPIQPTPVPTPTPTSPNPNLQYLPQKAYVQSYAPEVGIPSSAIPLQPVPTVVPAQPVQQSSTSALIDNLDILGLVSMVTSAGAYLKGHLVGKKTDETKQTVQAVAEHQVKQDVVNQKTLELQYETMPDKGASITDKPEIKLEEVAKLKDEALKTASKA